MMQWLVLIPTVINVICALIYMFAPRRHRHDWSPWSPWVISETVSHAEALRYRHCQDCTKMQQQETGYHRCFDNRCKHLKFLNETQVDQIKRLEKELGL